MVEQGAQCEPHSFTHTPPSLPMKSTTSMRLLLLAVVATPLVAFWPEGEQDPDNQDWAKHVRKACESRRFGIRLAAAKRVALGGDAAVPAVVAYVEDKGLNAIPSSLVDAIADSGKDGLAVRGLLNLWAGNQDFYWRSSAMRGLALRLANNQAPVNAAAPNKNAADAPPDSKAVFAHGQSKYHAALYQNDPAWLMRTHARFGIALASTADNAAPGSWEKTKDTASRELDPRARVRLTRLLLEQGKVTPLQPLFDALADQRTFLETPWGPRLGQEAKKALKRWLGDDFPAMVEGDQAASIKLLRDAAQKKSGQTITLPQTKSDKATDISGGVEILSCKFGDQFVQWTEDGTLHFGIDGSRTAKLPADVWQKLSKQRTQLALEKNAGVVVCDSLRLRMLDPDTNAKVAPESLPQPAAEWLKQLAQRLEEANETELAADLRRGLGQFEGR